VLEKGTGVDCACSGSSLSVAEVSIWVGDRRISPSNRVLVSNVVQYDKARLAHLEVVSKFWCALPGTTSHLLPAAGIEITT
jgi:hypothetical protein